MLSCCVPSLRLNDFPIFFLNINFPTGPGLILDFLANGFVPVLSAKKEPYQLVASSSHSLSSHYHHHYCPLLHFFIRSRTRGRRTWRPESIRLEPDPLVDTRRSAREPSDRLGNVAMTLSPVPFPCYDSRPMKALKEYNQYS